MKKFNSILLLLVITVTLVAQITVLNTGTTQGLSTVFFVNTNIGFACGENGTIIKTANGGTTWSVLNTGTTHTLNSIFFTDSNNGYAVGGLDMVGGIVLKTTNGGTNWTLQTVCNSVINDVFFTSATTGYIAGAYTCGTGLYKTTDAGLTWNSIANPNSSIWNIKLFFLDENNGFVAGSYEKLNKTTDAGVNWTGSIKMSSTNHLTGLWFTSLNTGYTVGTSGIIKKTTDGGTTWTNMTGASDLGVRRIRFVTPTTGYAVGNGVLLKTTDSGITWEPQTSTNTLGLGNIFFLDATTGYTCGASGTILKINVPSNITKITDKFAANIINVFPNPTKEQVTVSFDEFNKANEFAICISNILGQKIYYSRLYEEKTTIDLSKISHSGLHLIQIINNYGVVIEEKKLIIQ